MVRKKNLSGILASLLFIGVFLVILSPASADAYAADSGCVKVSNGLPVIYINIDESQGTIEDMIESPNHSVNCYGTISIDSPALFRYSDMPKALNRDFSNLSMSIRGRGNSTWQKSIKKPFKIKFDEQVDLLGRGANKHYVLIANSFDPSLMRDRITAWIGDSFGFAFTPRGVPVDLVMTGSEYGSRYLGSYYLSENVRVDKNRVNIDNPKKSDTELPKISGDYLLIKGVQVDRNSPDLFLTKRGVQWATDTPSFDPSDDGYENPAQQEYIQNHMQRIENALFGKDFTNEFGESYRDLIDIDSAAKYWLVNEFSLNGDAFMTGSTYVYKKRDADGITGKLFCGPLWDFDYAWNHGSTTEGFSGAGEWTQALLYDQTFRSAVYDQWPTLRSKLKKLTKKGGVIDRYYLETLRSANKDIKLYGRTESYAAEVADLKNWINARTDWFDKHIYELDDFMHRVTYIADGEVYHIDYLQDGFFTRDDLDHPQKDGYVFLGWADQNGNITDERVRVTEDMTLTAKYVSESDATHAVDIAFRKDCDVIQYNVNAPRYQINYSVIPADAQYRTVEWSSSDESFASVDEEGIVSFSGPGEVTITAKLKYGNTRQFRLTITKEPAPIPEAIMPENEVINMMPGEQLPFNIKTEPSPARIRYYEYESEDTDVVTVDDYGILTAAGTGRTKVRLTVRNYDQSGKEIVLETYVSVIVSNTEPEPAPQLEPSPEPASEPQPQPSPAPAPEAAAKTVRSVTINSKTVSAKAVKAAIKRAGGSSRTVTTVVLGDRVERISKGSFKNYKNIKTLQIRSKKLRKASVRGSLKGSGISRIKVRVSRSRETNRKHLERYRKYFTRKNTGRKVKVS